MKQSIITYLFFLLVFGGLSISTQAQNYSNLRQKYLSTSQDTVLLDTLSVIPESFSLHFPNSNEKIDPSVYFLDAPSATLIWTEKLENDSIWAEYRVFPFLFTEKNSHKSTEVLGQVADQPLKYIEIKEGEANEWIDFGGLNYQGSFGRGIQVGNTQDLSVNSDFNLQLSGKMSNGVEVLAAISDNNIPFQAQGNTQQLQEFDRIFIQVHKNQHTLRLGDYQILRPNSHFMNFQKKLQGIQYRFDSKDKSWQSTNSFAVARGRYRRQTFNGEEGNQGPYKLIGANGETFIIILSGSERVYIDGVLMTRGFDNDYVIDYNLGEVQFTANQLITKDKRIVVEFEYAQRNFLRSLAHHQTEYQNDKLKVRLNLYSEQDAKNQTGLQDLSDNQRAFISSIGDNTGQILAPSASPSAYDANRVLYQKIDTLINGQVDSFFRYSNNPELDLYTVTFTNVGMGNGEYLLVNSTLNGRVYEWVGIDVSGNFLGTHEPIVQLVAPQKRQLATLAADYQMSEKTLIQTEISISGNDVNTFSKINDADNTGAAVWLAVNHEEKLDKAEKWSLELNGNYEFVDFRFRPLEIYRTTEFARDWSLPVTQNGLTGGNEHLGGAGLSLKRKDWGSVDYQFSILNTRGEIRQEGKRHLLRTNINRNGWLINAQVNYVQSDNLQFGLLYRNEFIRPNFSIVKTIGKWKTGIRYEQENKQEKGSLGLGSDSFNFEVFEIFTGTETENGNEYYFSYKNRIDDLPQTNGQFALATKADDFSIRGSLGKTAKNKLLWKGTYRVLEVDEEVVPNQQDKKTLLGEITYNWTAFKGMIRSSTSYELGSGQQQKVEYFYSPVAASLGDFIWVDRNENKLQESNEFEIATENNLEDSIRYIRLIIPANEFERTSKTRFNQSFSLNPKALWFNKKGFLKALSLFSAQSSVLLNNQFKGEEGFDSYNPFYQNDSTQVTANTSIRNTFFFNKGKPKYGADIFYNLFENKVLLISGTDKQNRAEYGFRGRLALGTNWTATLEGQRAEEETLSKAFEDRDYLIKSYEIEPKLTYRNGVKFRASIAYLQKNSENVLMNTSQIANERNLTAESRWSIVNRNVLSLRLSWVNITFEDELGNPHPTNTAAAFQILEGLQPGQNYVWSLNYETRLKNNIQLSFGYNGKKSRDLPVTNVGRASVRALF